jgi:hypothetical protein
MTESAAPSITLQVPFILLRHQPFCNEQLGSNRAELLDASIDTGRQIIAPE